LGDAEGVESGGEGSAGVLGALVAVVDETMESAGSLGGGALEGFEDERGFHVVCSGPADNAAAEEVDLCGEEEPTFLSGNVGDISDPRLIWSSGSGSMEQELGGGVSGEGAIGGTRDKAAFLHGAKSLLLHEPGNAASAAAVATVAQFMAQPGSAIGLAALHKGITHFTQEDLVLLGAGTLGLMTMSVEAAAADLEGFTDLGGGIQREGAQPAD
jgi:hypothetical protein